MNKSGDDKISISGWYGKHPAILFIVSFILLMVAFYIVYFSQSVQSKLLLPVIYLYAKLSGVLLHLIGYQVAVTGDLISSSLFSIGIKQGCDAVEPMAIFAAGVLAFPVGWRKKIRGLAAGMVILFVINLIRISSLFIAGVHSKEMFETMHVVVWQILFILIAIGLLFIWLQWTVRKSV